MQALVSRQFFSCRPFADDPLRAGQARGGELGLQAVVADVVVDAGRGVGDTEMPTRVGRPPSDSRTPVVVTTPGRKFSTATSALAIAS